MNKTVTEIDRKFSAIMLRWIKSQWKIEEAHQNGEPYTRMKFEADSAKVEKELKDLLEEAKKEGEREMGEKISSLMNENSFDYSQLTIDRNTFNLLVSPKPIKEPIK